MTKHSRPIGTEDKTTSRVTSLNTKTIVKDKPMGAIKPTKFHKLETENVEDSAATEKIKTKKNLYLNLILTYFTNLRHSTVSINSPSEYKCFLTLAPRIHPHNDNKNFFNTNVA